MTMRFQFPIVVIDEDFRSENASGVGIRALTRALEEEGVEIIGVTSFSDVRGFAQQHSRASAFILSVDDEDCLLYTSPSPRDGLLSRMPSSA